MAQFKLPSSNNDYLTLNLDTFSGVDFTNTPSKCSLNRSPDCENMIRDTPGKVRKRVGYETLESITDAINGHHVLKTTSGEIEFIHAGTKIYKYTPNTTPHLTSMYTTANNAKSSSVVINGYLWIFDGLKLLKVSSSAVVAADTDAYVPKIMTGRAPSGGGTILEAVNLLSAKRYVGFYADGTSATFYLPDTSITSVEKVQKLVDGEYTDMVLTTDYTVNLTNGTVTFTTTPAAGSGGTDSHLVYYTKPNSSNAEMINKCNMCTLYGVGGGQDRIFATGNPDYPGRDFFCEIRNPQYWGDIWYSVLGEENSAIMNYAIIDNCLAAFKNSGENNVNVFLRTGTLEEVTEQVNGVDVVYYDPTFAITGTYQSEDIIAKYSFQMFGNEPVYLTARGIHALTLVSLTNSRNSEQRSYYLNGDENKGLLHESDLQNAHSVVYNGFYILCVNNHCYVLDSLQAVSEKGTLDSSSKKQYEGFYWTNIPAKVMWNYNGNLYFGTSDGKICKFFTDVESPSSYYDNSTIVSSYWCTAHIRGKYPLNWLTIISLGYTLSAFITTSVDIFIRVQGIFQKVIENVAAGRYFSYQPLDYGAMTYSGDSTEQSYTKKIRACKKADKFQLKLENKKAEPMSIEAVEITYRQGGKYKNRG